MTKFSFEIECFLSIYSLHSLHKSIHFQNPCKICCKIDLIEAKHCLQSSSVFILFFIVFFLFLFLFMKISFHKSVSMMHRSIHILSRKPSLTTLSEFKYKALEGDWKSCALDSRDIVFFWYSTKMYLRVCILVLFKLLP